MHPKYFRTELEDNREHMDNLQDDVTTLRNKLQLAEKEIEAIHCDSDQMQEQAQNEINVSLYDGEN